MRERYKGLVAMTEIVPDYLSASAYNEGVKAVSTQANTALDREDEVEGDHHVVVQSSSRSNIHNSH
jgi:hypothetical protein